MSDPASVPEPDTRADGGHGSGPQGPSPIADWPGAEAPTAVPETDSVSGEGFAPQPGTGAAESSGHGDVENAKNQKLLAQASQIAGDLQTQGERKRVVKGMSVDIGCRRLMKKKTLEYVCDMCI